ncbi:hypothetical protein HZS55_14555 [Halosimplex rubrum]|uniref:Sulfatase-like hydrolase/transferase n=1 Tax=Halosimplex rubrum TaxID=869889 RepID=A0A7D5P3U3_9EURY|nr:hypothetical protein [Halosimplex rubrum]QLH78441.1 hypothetical protein HZS55_14555 [Halosimplex rubrum]
MADEGYTCGLSGKLHISARDPRKEDRPKMMERWIEDGYANFNWSHGSQHPSPANEYQLWLREQGASYEHTPVDGSDHVQTYAPAEHHQTTWCAERAIDFMEKCADKDEPWLFSVNMFDPHHPFDPPREYLECYLDRLDKIPLPNYEDGELDDKPVFQRIDHDGAYGGDLLVHADMDDEDHRDYVGQYEMMRKTAGVPESLIRILMFFHGPSVETSEDAHPVHLSLTDVMPTLCKMVGTSILEGVQWKSLWPVVIGGKHPTGVR